MTTSHRQTIDAQNKASDMRKGEIEFKIAILRALRLNLAAAREVDEVIFGEAGR